eukprot:Em0008g955a
MLYLVGLGLGDAKDISVKGLEVVRNASKVYLEAYTSILTVGKEELELFYGRELIVADREMVETNSDEILADADKTDVAFLVVGDPLGATTHTDLLLRAAELGIQWSIVHNASIINAVGCCGLQLYRFGETVSIPFWTETWKPESFVDKIEQNLKVGLHTLCLLDIKMKEQSLENLMRGRKIFEPPKFMTVSQAAAQLLEVIAARSAAGTPLKCLSSETHCVGLARVGTETQTIARDVLAGVCRWEMGKPLHSLVIIGHLHPLEEKILALSNNAHLV